MTSCERSTLFCSSSEIVCLTYLQKAESDILQALEAIDSLFCSNDVPVDKHFLQTCSDDSRDKPTVVSPYSLNTFCVHLVEFIWSRPVQTGITFLADEQVGEVDLFEFQLDWIDELLRDFCGSFGACISTSANLEMLCYRSAPT